MKKWICVILVLIITLGLLCACSSEFTCDICRKTKSGTRYKLDIMGETVVYCSDCEKGLGKLTP